MPIFFQQKWVDVYLSIITTQEVIGQREFPSNFLIIFVFVDENTKAIMNIQINNRSGIGENFLVLISNEVRPDIDDDGGTDFDDDL